MLFSSHYLVDIENEDIGRVLKLDSLKNGELWKEMDVVIFNTWLWWYRSGPKQPYEHYIDAPNINDFYIEHEKNLIVTLIILTEFF